VSIGNAGGPNPNQASGDPRHQLELVNNNGSLQLMAISTYSTGATFQNNLHWNRFDGSIGSPSNVLSGDTFMSMGYRGWDGSGTLSQSMAAYYSKATENWDSTHHGIEFEWDVTPAGGSVRQNIFELAASASSNLPAMITNGVGDTSRGRLEIKDTAGTRYGYLGKASNGTITYESDAAVQLVGNNGVDALVIDASHNLAYNSVNINPVGGTFTLTVASGCTTTPTSTATWMKVGSIVTMHTGSGLTCTSNAAGFSASGLPASLQPNSLITSVPLAVCTNNTVASSGNCYVTFNPSTGTLTFGLNGNTGGWTSSGTKAVVGNFTYSIQ
jgi:hypothetical protein